MPCITGLLILACSVHENTVHKHSSVNFNHLEHLTETICLNNDSCAIVHIYAEYPSYNWVEAPGEGIACVDDVARAVIIYLRFYEISKADSVLEKARMFLKFVLKMQTEEGRFYNFITPEYEINKTAQTSSPSFSFWAARGYWALASGYRIFKSIDQEFAKRLKDAFLKCKIPLAKNLELYPEHSEINGRRYPRWLIGEYASDATSAFLLGLAEYFKVEKDTELENMAALLAEGIIAMQVQSDRSYEGAFLSWRNIWHAWGNMQTQALASLGKILSNQIFINAAKQEADHYYMYLLIHGMLREWHLTHPEKASEFPQIAYDIRCMAVGLIRLYEATNNEDYAKMAGLAASWLMGNNAANCQMYDPCTGRGFDGIIDRSAINLNSGAESTIESLYTIIEISNNPIARQYLNYKTVETGYDKDSVDQTMIPYRIFANESGEKIKIAQTDNSK